MRAQCSGPACPRCGAQEDILGFTVTVKNVCQRLFPNVHTVGFVRVTDCCKGLPFPADVYSQTQRALWEGGRLMSSELPKQEVDCWNSANALQHCLSVSSVPLGLIDPSPLDRLLRTSRQRRWGVNS